MADTQLEVVSPAERGGRERQTDRQTDRETERERESKGSRGRE